MERVKAIPRSASGAAEADSYRPELLADDEPRYLRRQKPVEIRRKKFSGRGWPFYRRLLVLSAGGVVGATAAYYGMQFLLYSPSMLLLKPDQIEVNGNRIVSREAVLQQFVHDRNRSVLQVPLEARRSQLEQIPWVESASVQRILPNRLRIELQREKRMQTYAEFMKDVDLVRSGSSDRVSEVDLSIPKDLRVVMTGLANAGDSQAVTIHFGSSEFTGKFKMLVDNFSQWQANAGHVQSIDLQYSRQVVVNPDTSAGTTTARTK